MNKTDDLVVGDKDYVWKPMWEPRAPSIQIASLPCAQRDLSNLHSGDNSSVWLGTSEPSLTVHLTESVYHWRVENEEQVIWIVIDDGRPLEHFPVKQWGVVNYLRSHGRPTSAEEAQIILQDIEAGEGDARNVNFVSLWSLASFLVDNQQFDDPIISADSFAIWHAQWHIRGDGVIVLSFLDEERILLNAQADASPEGKELYISSEGSKEEVLGMIASRVPYRY